MMPLSQLLMDREWGLPYAQSQLSEGIDQLTADNLINDRFRNTIIELPEGFRYSFFRCEDFVAVANLSKTDRSVTVLALWSLSLKCKLWETKIIKEYEELNPSECLVSDSGMVLMDSLQDRKIIVVDGIESGALPKGRWLSTLLSGTKILTSWTVCHNSNARGIEREFPENSKRFFGEWGKEGTLLYRFQLSHKKGRSRPIYTHSESFWVKLSGSSRNDVASIIEVVNRTLRTYQKYALPLYRDEELFSSACILDNQLIYAINSIRQEGEFRIPVNDQSTICIRDLTTGTILKQFPLIDPQSPQQLTVSGPYIAWIQVEDFSHHVKFLNVLDSTIRNVTTISDHLSGSSIALSLFKNSLSIISEGFPSHTSAFWRRQVVDMESGELKYSATYDCPKYQHCSLFKGDLLITNHPRSYPKRSLYIESFAGEGLSTQAVEFRTVRYKGDQ